MRTGKISPGAPPRLSLSHRIGKLCRISFPGRNRRLVPACPPSGLKEPGRISARTRIHLRQVPASPFKRSFSKRRRKSARRSWKAPFLTRRSVHHLRCIAKAQRKHRCAFVPIEPKVSGRDFALSLRHPKSKTDRPQRNERHQSCEAHRAAGFLPRVLVRQHHVMRAPGQSKRHRNAV